LLQQSLSLWRRRLAAKTAAAQTTASSATADPLPPPSSLSPGAVLTPLPIARLGADGKAIALLPPTNFVVLVDQGLPGEVIEARVTSVKKGFAEAERLRTLAAPTDATSFVHPPPCPDTAAGLLLAPRPIAGGCGGCALQALPYARQLEHKAEAVRQALLRVGGLSADEVALAERAIVGCLDEPGRRRQWGYRNKASFVVSSDVWSAEEAAEGAPTSPATAQIGFTAPGTRRTVVPVASCGLQPESANAVLRAVRRLAAETGVLSSEAGKNIGIGGPKRLRRLVVRSASAARASSLASSLSSSPPERDHMVVLFTDRGYPRGRLQPLAEALQADKALRVVSVVHCEEEEQQQVAAAGAGALGARQRRGKQQAPAKRGGDEPSTSRHAPRAPRLVSTTVLAGKPYLVETLRVRAPLPPDASTAPAPPRPDLHLSFAVSPGSFFQVNSDQAGLLYGLVLEAALAGLEGGASGPVTILDLFCGAGAIGVSLAAGAAAPAAAGGEGEGIVLFGVDSSAAAIADARLNARRNGLDEDQAAFACGDLDDLAASLERALLLQSGGGGVAGSAAPAKKARGGAPTTPLALPAGASLPRVIVVNPARAGLGVPVVQFLLGAAAADAETIVYVSCNPRSLARDLARLRGGGGAGGGGGGGAGGGGGGAVDGGWELAWFRPVDLMPQTDHVETVAVLRRRRR
jgi:tRNA/tmRNA/rRNA uracil-C5-methylase (TrmA/RlmC/RlmD family)